MSPEIPPFGTGELTAEWPVLTAACSPNPTGESNPTATLSSVDWNVLLALAEEHGVTAHLARALEPLAERVPKASQALLHERRRAQVVSTLGMTAELLPLLNGFQGRNLKALVIKGPVLSVRAYGDPGMRQYGDIDLLLRSSDIERATNVMTEAGFEPQVKPSDIKSNKIPGEYLFRRTSTRMLVELHTEQSLRFFPKPLPVEDYFQRSVSVQLDGHDVLAMAPEDELVHICVHGTKHLWERLMWVADVAAILGRWSTQRSQLDWNRVAASAHGVGAERMLAMGLHLANKVLCAPLPEEFARKIHDDRDIERIGAEIQRRLPFAGYRRAGLIERAAYRVAMRGGGIPGFLYLWRLTLLPTERDWHGQQDAGAARTLLRRLRRLARDHGRATGR